MRREKEVDNRLVSRCCQHFVRRIGSDFLFLVPIHVNRQRGASHKKQGVAVLYVTRGHLQSRLNWLVDFHNTGQQPINSGAICIEL